MHRKFGIFFPTEIENFVFLVHDDHIVFVHAGEKGIEISVCFKALDANFWWPFRGVIPRIKPRAFSRPIEFASKGQGSISFWCAIFHKNGKRIINL